MTQDQLKEIEARLKAASPGPWREEQIDEYPSRWAIHSQEDIIMGITIWSPAQISAVGPESWDTDFIINAPSDIAALLEHVKYQDALIDSLQKEIGHFSGEQYD